MKIGKAKIASIRFPIINETDNKTTIALHLTIRSLIDVTLIFMFSICINTI